jgi:hypothetical protein
MGIPFMSAPARQLNDATQDGRLILRTATFVPRHQTNPEKPLLTNAPENFVARLAALPRVVAHSYESHCRDLADSLRKKKFIVAP